MMEIGILGGTFDPIHNGHLQLAQHAMEQFQLDKIWLMPSPNPPHKVGKKVTDYAMRAEMVELAISGFLHFERSDFENQRGGKSYTSDTLQALREQYPEIQFSFIMGADSLYEIETWHRPEVIFSLARILVAMRDYQKEHRELRVQSKYLREKYWADIEFISYPRVDISSEQIRQLCREKGSIASYVPAKVLEFIKQHHLYQ